MLNIDVNLELWYFYNFLHLTNRQLPLHLTAKKIKIYILAHVWMFPVLSKWTVLAFSNLKNTLIIFNELAEIIKKKIMFI